MAETYGSPWFVSLVPEFRNHLGYVKEEREASRIKMSIAKLAVDGHGVPKSIKQTNLLPIIHQHKAKIREPTNN